MRAAIQGWVERSDRHALDMDATAYRQDGSPVGVTVLNISYDGCQIESGADFAIGEKIRLILPRMSEIKAQIRWTSLDGKVGTRFLLEEIALGEQHSRLGL